MSANGAESLGWLECSKAVLTMIGSIRAGYDLTGPAVWAQELSVHPHPRQEQFSNYKSSDSFRFDSLIWP